ncbi:MAG TPA: Spy/CpxP family protein refolding chaperone [Candidatus Omnitrophota bacterium]|nr:Spy/CpxP family protein refolding chaperone [Candidatus Omnitrophota bacterium]HPS36973.1 Spy/CpxP family protein refolding chaperone [Candidatus Omnitrophota bacterium]
MDRKMKIAVITVMLLSAAGVCGWANETGPGDDREPGMMDEKGQHGKGKEAFFKELNLTAEQKQKLDELRQAGRETNQGVRDQLKAKMQELHAEIAKPQSDATKVKDLVADISTLKSKMFQSHVDGILAMKTVLTPEQFTKMEELRKKHMESKKGKWGKHHEEGPEGGPEGGLEEGPGPQ